MTFPPKAKRPTKALRELMRGPSTMISDLDQLTTANARIARLEEAIKIALSSLVAATSLLKRGSKKAAPSDKMFDMMINDYEHSADRAREILAALRKAEADELPLPSLTSPPRTGPRGASA